MKDKTLNDKEPVYDKQEEGKNTMCICQAPF